MSSEYLDRDAIFLRNLTASSCERLPFVIASERECVLLRWRFCLGTPFEIAVGWIYVRPRCCPKQNIHHKNTHPASRVRGTSAQWTQWSTSATQVAEQTMQDSLAHTGQFHGCRTPSRLLRGNGNRPYYVSGLHSVLCILMIFFRKFRNHNPWVIASAQA